MATEYGVVCHYMDPAVDAGTIIREVTFPVYDTDDVESLLRRSHVNLLVVFFEIVDQVLNSTGLTPSDVQWQRRPFKRNDFEEINQIAASMSDDEVARRIRATKYGEFEPRKI